MKRNVLIIAGLLVILLVVVEVALRVFFGLASPPLVYTSAKFGYAFRPNQTLKRFRHPISYNEQGLRSEPLRPLTGGAFRILCVGGSVTNGGALVNQADTYPYQLEKILSAKGDKVQVLNASAVGWTLTNEYGFLEDKGIFGARVVILEVGTRMLYPGPAATFTVGADPNLPEDNPPLAIVEAVDRYLLPRLLRKLRMSSAEAPVWSDRSVTLENYQRGLGTLKAMVTLVSKLGAKPIILLTPDKDEAVPGRYRAHYQKDLSDLATSVNGKVLDLMPAWHTALSQGREPLRDSVDPNSEGNQAIAQALAAEPLP